MLRAGVRRQKKRFEGIFVLVTCDFFSRKATSTDNFLRPSVFMSVSPIWQFLADGGRTDENFSDKKKQYFLQYH